MREPTRSSVSQEAGEAARSALSSESRLLARARRGSHGAAEVLFGRYGSWLRNWARGRLPQWVRGTVDTSDVVQDTLQHTLARLEGFESPRAGALRAYLRRALENRIHDEFRRATRRQDAALPDPPVPASDDGAPQLRRLLDEEVWRRYVDGLRRLRPRDRRLIVGRAELGYSYQQLASIERLPSSDAARMALRRALVRLSNVISHP